MTIIALGADHGGFELKEIIKKHLQAQAHYVVNDLGTYSQDSVDYPVFAKAVAEEVVGAKTAFGILVCGTGIGISIAANKIAGIRAALVHDEFTAKMSREHNNANVLSLGARFLSIEEAKDVVSLWLATPFSNEPRHVRRVKKLDSL